MIQIIPTASKESELDQPIKLRLMYLKILVLDLDGTIATNDKVSDRTIKTLRQAKASGFILILATGRRLEPLSSMGPFDELCEAIVAEDGAVVYFPGSDSVLLPFGRLDEELFQQLEDLEIPMEKGLAIAATWVPHDKEVSQILTKSGYPATIEYNKGAVMVMPPGATKGTGLLIALRELGYSPRNVLACGDAENDRSMLKQAELAVTLANAAPGIQDLADVVLPYANGRGVRYLIEQLMTGEIPPHPSKPDRRIELGTREDNSPVRLSPANFLEGNLLIAGRSGSGKSWLAGLLVEELLKLNYQICIIDPEGDYSGLRSFPHTLLLGGDHPPPPVADVITICEYSNISIILDLSLLGNKALQQYVADLLRGLTALRARRGQPHWFLLDEAHYFCGLDENGDSLKELILENMDQGGFGLVSYRPSLICPEILDKVLHFMFTQIRDSKERALIGNLVPTNPELERLPALPRKQAFLSLGKTPQLDAPPAGIIHFNALLRIVPHVRHLHKYLMAPLPKPKRFYFRLSPSDSGPTVAASMWEFRQAIPALPLTTIEYHLMKGDFERWFREVLRDKELAKRIRKMSRRRLEKEACGKPWPIPLSLVLKNCNGWFDPLLKEPIIRVRGIRLLDPAKIELDAKSDVELTSLGNGLGRYLVYFRLEFTAGIVVLEYRFNPNRIVRVDGESRACSNCKYIGVDPLFAYAGNQIIRGITKAKIRLQEKSHIVIQWKIIPCEWSEEEITVIGFIFVGLFQPAEGEVHADP